MSVWFAGAKLIDTALRFSPYGTSRFLGENHKVVEKVLVS